MKNKKAFTLIELLAVIVILIIVLAITIPIISNVIDSTKKASFKSDAKLVLDQVRIQISKDEDFDPTSISYDTLGTYNISNENYESLTVSMVNSKPYIYIVGKNKWNGYKACGTYQNMNVYLTTEEGVCEGETPANVSVEAYAWGAGGAGGTAGGWSYGAAGGAGGAASGTIVIDPNTIYSIVVGRGWKSK